MGCIRFVNRQNQETGRHRIVQLVGGEKRKRPGAGSIRKDRVIVDPQKMRVRQILSDQLLPDADIFKQQQVLSLEILVGDFCSGSQG